MRMISRDGLPFLVLSLFLAASCSPAPNGDEPATRTVDLSAPADDAAADGWRPLFDGRTTAGWRAFKGTAMPAGWQVVDGSLTRGEQGGDIVTDEEFD
ncbi:MAG TPA: family 16 glycoside hydrolase, partial [Longimicrobium sp.]|nr:family 16 glycoside hydrolase [Longimicrobium sp.]